MITKEYALELLKKEYTFDEAKKLYRVSNAATVAYSHMEPKAEILELCFNLVYFDNPGSNIDAGPRALMSVLQEKFPEYGLISLTEQQLSEVADIMVAFENEDNGYEIRKPKEASSRPRLGMSG